MGLCYNTFNTGAELGLHLIYPKLKYIKEINKKLGLEVSNIRGITISRTKIEEITEYLKAERKSIHTLFNLKEKNNEIDITAPDKLQVRRNVEFLNKIYGSWTGMEIKSCVEDKKVKGKVNEYITTFAYGLVEPPPPYKITYNEIINKVCMINIEDVFDVPLVIAEPFIIAEIVEEIPEAIEILIPIRKNYEGYSEMYLENERLGLSQSPPPIIWKRRVSNLGH
jgi:hypothetical protein